MCTDVSSLQCGDTTLFFIFLTCGQRPHGTNVGFRTATDGRRGETDGSFRIIGSIKVAITANCLCARVSASDLQVEKMSFSAVSWIWVIFSHLSISDRPHLDSEGVHVPNASMPGGLPIVRGRRPGVVLVPGVGASFLGVGVLDLRLGVDDLSF